MDIKQKFRSQINSRREKRTSPAPRYDEVFSKGTEMLDREFYANDTCVDLLACKRALILIANHLNSSTEMTGLAQEILNGNTSLLEDLERYYSHGKD